MVRWFVEQQRERMAEQRLCQQIANFLPDLKLTHFSLVQLVRNIEALQQNCGVSLGSVTVFFTDDAFQLAELHSIFISKFGLRMDSITLLHCRPQTLVAHHHSIDHPIRVESKLVLA